MKQKPFQPWRYLTACSLSYLGTGVFMCVNTLVSLSRGMDLAQVSLGLALASLTSLVLELPSGMAGDLFGRKRVWMMAAAAQALQLALFLFAGGPVLLLAYVLNGVSNALISGTLDALYMEGWIHSRGADTLAKASAWNAAAQTGSMAVGSLAGGVLAALPFFREYTVNLLAVCALRLAALVWVALMIPADAGHGRAQQQTRPSLLRQFMAQGRTAWDAAAASGPLTLCLLSTVALGFGMIGLEAFWKPRLLELAPADAQLGPVLGVLSGISMLGALGGSVLCAQFTKHCHTQRRRILAFLLTRTLLAAALLAVAGASKVPSFALLFTGYYLTLGMHSTTEDVVLQGEAPDEARGTLMSVESLLLQVGVFFSQLVSSAWLLRGSIRALWVLEAIVLLGGTALAVGACRRAQRRKTVETPSQNG